MLLLRRLAITLLTTALLTAVVYGAGWAIRPDHGAADGNTPTEARERGTDGPGRPDDPSQGRDDRPGPTGRETPAPPAEPERPPKPIEPELTPGPRLLGPDDSGTEVRDLQARLKQIAWFYEDVTGFYGPVTTEAVRGFQAKREIPVTGEVDQRTLDRLHAMTRQPTDAELTNQPETNAPGALDPRCTTGRVLCIDKTSRTLRWVVDGDVQDVLDVRFGSEYTPTREGVFSVFAKSRDHVSSIYDTAMPYAMFFSGGQAVHYSPDFAAVGYAGASHGCVNVRDEAGIARLFDQVQVGDRVVVYWS